MVNASLPTSLGPALSFSLSLARARALPLSDTRAHTLTHTNRFLYASCALHSAAVFFCCCWAIHNGAQYYHYSFGPKFSKALKETLAKEYATSDWD